MKAIIKIKRSEGMKEGFLNCITEIRNTTYADKAKLNELKMCWDSREKYWSNSFNAMSSVEDVASGQIKMLVNKFKDFELEVIRG